MKLWTIISSVVGIALTFWLLSEYGIDRILTLLVQAGWAIPLVALFHVTQIVCSGIGWRMVVAEGTRPQGWRIYILLRWLREGINNLLPVAQFGGVVFTTRLLIKRGVKVPEGLAGATVDTTLEFVSHLFFILICLGILLMSAVNQDVGQYLVAGIATTAALAIGLLVAQWLGLARIIEWLAGKFRKGWSGTEENNTRGFHEALMGVYRNPRRIAVSFIFHLFSWILGAVEIYISLRALGYQTRFTECLIIEALAQAVRSAGFAVPGSLGVQEGGYVLAGGMFGLPPEVGIALSLVKRLRDILLGLPALAVWSWMEGRKPVQA